MNLIDLLCKYRFIVIKSIVNNFNRPEQCMFLVAHIAQLVGQQMRIACRNARGIGMMVLIDPTIGLGLLNQRK